MDRPRSVSRRDRPTMTSWPSTRPLAPSPGRARKRSTRGSPVTAGAGVVDGGVGAGEAVVAGRVGADEAEGAGGAAGGDGGREGSGGGGVGGGRLRRGRLR